MRQKNVLRIAFSLVLIFSFTVISAQIYNADFSNDGDGFTDHTSSLPPAAAPASVGPFGTSPNQWSLSYTSKPATDSANNFFKVIGGSLIASDWGGLGVFESQAIDVSSINTININAIGETVGNNVQNAGAEFFKYYYILDGGTAVETDIVLSGDSDGDPVNYSVVSLDVSSANSLVVGYSFNANGDTDGYSISSFTVSEIASATPGITLGAVSGNTNESGTTATFSAVLDAQPSTDVVLNISSGDTGEVTVSPATLTFTNANWDTPQTITLTGVNDALLDGNVDVTITVSVDDANSDDDFDAVADVTTTVTNEDDENPPSLGFDTTTSSETETDATFTSSNIPITVSDYSGERIDINVAITGGTAEVSDYTYTTQSLSFTANGTQNITVDINDDADSDDETVILTITETSSVTGLTISEATHTITIIDDDLIVVVSEEILNENFDNDTNFVKSESFFSDGTGDYFGIYDPVDTTDNFGVGNEPTSIPSFTNNTGNFLVGEDLDGDGTSATQTLTWENLSISGYTDLNFSVKLGASSGFDTTDKIELSVNIDDAGYTNLASFSSASGSNQFPTNGSVTLGLVMQTITGSILNTGNTLDLKLTVIANSDSEEFAVDDIIINGTPTATTPTITFDEATSSEAETDVTFATSGIPITLTNYDEDVTITVTINNSSTAESGDYTIDLTPLVFDANKTINIPLSINNDADFDDETLIIDFTVTSGTADLGTSTHTVTIIDDENPPLIGFDTTTSSETETDATFTSSNIPITVSDYSGEQIDINVAITGGTAEAGDYTYTTQSLSFTANGTQDISVDINDDADSDDETIIFTITETSSVTGLTISEATHTVTITDDEAPVLIASQNFEALSSDNWSYTPNPAAGVFTASGDEWDVVSNLGGLATMPTNSSNFFGGSDIENSDNSNGDYGELSFASVNVFGYTGVILTFDYEVDGFDSGDDIDYTVSIDGIPQTEVKLVDGFSNLDANGTATIPIPDGSISVSMVIKITQDGNSDYVGIDNFQITGTPPSTDPTITFNAANSSQTETDVTFATSGIPITLTNYDADVTVTATVNASSTAEVGDYVIDLTPIVFDANETLTIPLSINPDADFANETIIIDITVTSGTADLGTSTHTVTITDDDLPAIVISEIMYNSSGTDDEWIELYNNTGSDVDISDWTLDNTSGAFPAIYTIPSSTIIADGTYITIAIGSNGDGTFNNDNPFTPDLNILGVTNAAVANTVDTNHLVNSSSTFTLNNSNGVSVDSVTYNEVDTDGEHDGDGESLELLEYTLDNATTATNWLSSGFNGGTPGADNASVWSGAIDSDWTDSGNWSFTGVPNSSENFIIPAGLSNYPVVTNAVTVVQGVIRSGASLIAQSTFTGTITYERTLTTANWYLMSSPVAGEGYDATWVIDNRIDDTSSASSNIGIAAYTPLTNSWAYVQDGGSGSFISGIGYSIKQDFFGNLSFTGTINTSDVATNVVVDGDGFNLIGNPFTTNISTNSFLTDNTNNLDSQTLWVWNQAINAYETFVAVDNFVLAPTQGFFVKANATTSLNFAESYQTATAGIFQKSAKTEVKISINDGKDKRYSRINYFENASQGFDNGYDGELFGGIKNNFSIYTHLIKEDDGKKYQVQSLPNTNYENQVVPIGITADANKQITFTAKTLNIPTGIKVFLEDKRTNTFTRLDEVANEYTISLAEKVDGFGRFYLHTKSSILSTPETSLHRISVYNLNSTTLRVTGLFRGESNIKIFNILGKQVLNDSFISNDEKNIDLPHLSSGIYIVQVTTEAGQLHKKIRLK